MKPLFALALFLLAPALLAPSASAQEVRHATSCTLHDHGGVAVSGPLLDVHQSAAARRAGGVTRVVTRGTATFEVDYSGFTPEARAAFQRAVDIWAEHLTSPVPIRVSATFAPLGTNILGSAGPNLTSGFLDQPWASTWYPFALADALAGYDLNPDPGDFYYDIVAQFSSTNTRFYFGLDGNPPPNQFDFVTIVLHELGHGLGFVGSAKVDNGSGGKECDGVRGHGCWGYFDGSFSGLPLLFDQFLEDVLDRPLLDRSVYPNASTALGNLIESGALYVDAPEAVRIYGGPVPVWAPVPFDEGSSYSHWDEDVIHETSAALMTPQVAPREAYQDPGDITCAFFSDMGWALGAGCQTLTVDEEVGPAGLGLAWEPAGPNPFGRSTSFRITRDAPGPLRATAHDVLGRRVATLHDGPAAADVTLRFDAGGLAPGVYHVRVEADGAVLTRALTLVR